MSIKVYNTDNAPAAIGPYSHGVRCGNFIFTSGQIPLTADGKMETDVEKATLTVLNNLLAIVEAGGGKKENIIKVEIFVRDLDDFNTINKVYADFFGDVKPTRWLVQAAKMPNDAVLEAAAVAYID